MDPNDKDCWAERSTYLIPQYNIKGKGREYVQRTDLGLLVLGETVSCWLQVTARRKLAYEIRRRSRCL